MIERIFRKIPERKRRKMNYVHFGGNQILVKSTFKEGINCPIVINLSDERFINAREGNLGIIEGNLAYTKLLFTYYPKYCISLKDADFNDALNLHFQVKRNDLFKPGNHIMSIYYQALYTVTNSNYGSVYKNKEMIEIDQKCMGIVEVEIQQAQIPEEYEIRFGKTQEIGSSSNNPRLSLEYGRNSTKISTSHKYSKKILETSNITRIAGRVFNRS
uniref:Movement protein n=1 Tax=Solanum tuberosum TaxID=4113 RepID=M1DQ39_SOLTU